MGACEGPGSERTGPRLVVTHHLSWVRWSKGCKTLTSSRLEGPAVSHPSPAGPRSLHATQEHLCPAQRWTECPWTWEGAGRTESHSRVWWFSWASETVWGALARHPATEQAGLGEPPTYPLVGQRSGTQAGEPVAEQNKKETKDSLPGPPPGEGVHLLKSRIQGPRVARLRDATCPGASRAWQGWRWAAPLSCGQLYAAGIVKAAAEAELERRWRQQEGSLGDEQTEELQPAVG